MAAVLPAADRVLKAIDGRGAHAPARGWELGLVVCAAGALYGAVMGSFALDSAERALLMVYGAVKVPALIVATSLICLPGFYALNAVAGLRDDFRRALRAIVAGQAGMTAALASLAPITRVVYFSGVDHRGALLFNAGMFTVATAVGQVVMLRRYRELMARSRRHAPMLWVWVTMYAFVGIQMGWMLRPFVGTPGKAVTFLRDEAFSNAYLAVLRIAFGA